MNDNYLQIFLAPIRIGSCVVTGNLTLSEREDVKISRHIVGTKLDDLSQIYNGKVRIRGSLKVDHIVISQPNLNHGRTIYSNIQQNPLNTHNSMQNAVPNVIIDGHLFDATTIQNEYWMKNIDQVKECSKQASTRIRIMQCRYMNVLAVYTSWIEPAHKCGLSRTSHRENKNSDNHKSLTSNKYQMYLDHYLKLNYKYF